jgi:hypothetical protein
MQQNKPNKALAKCGHLCYACPAMQISPEDLERRLGSSKNLVNHLKTLHGRPTGRVNLTEPQRDVIGKLAHTMPQREVAERFGVSESTVSACKTGRIGGKPATEERRATREEFEGTVRDAALTKLMGALGLLTEESMETLNPKELSAVAYKLSGINSQLRGAVDRNAFAAANVTINLYAPEQRSEDKYKVIDAH